MGPIYGMTPTQKRHLTAFLATYAVLVAALFGLLLAT